MRRILFCLTVLLFTACGLVDKKPARNHAAVYYWKNSFELNATEEEFLKKYDVERMYIKFLEVDLDEQNRVVPNVTTKFNSAIPANVEVVPTVFIELNCLRHIEPGILADKLAEYLSRMSIRNKTGKISEIQIDYDWTKNTQDEYFDFLSALRDEARKRGWLVSATIRLHQLRMPVPPVDRGALMLYNTGAVANRETRNSILDYDDVKAYNAKNYDLPLDFAYPTFSWGVIFNDYRGNVRLINPQNLKQCEEKLVHLHDNWYVADEYLWDVHVNKRDTIRIENSELKEIKKVKLYVSHLCKENYWTIIYHLDSLNLSNYKSYEIKQIYK